MGEYTPLIVAGITVASAIALKIVDILWQSFTGGKNKTDSRIEAVETEMKKEIDTLQRNFSREHDKLEGRLDRSLGDINAKLETIKTMLDKGSSIERPVAVCREYIDGRFNMLQDRVNNIIGTEKK